MEPTSAQRRTADGIVSFYRGLREGGAVDPAETGELATAIAVALAAEREKARAPFLALVEEHEKWARLNRQLASEDMAGSDLHDGMRMAQEASAAHIYKVAQTES